MSTKFRTKLFGSKKKQKSTNTTLGDYTVTTATTATTTSAIPPVIGASISCPSSPSFGTRKNHSHSASYSNYDQPYNSHSQEFYQQTKNDPPMNHHHQHAPLHHRHHHHHHQQQPIPYPIHKNPNIRLTQEQQRIDQQNLQQKLLLQQQQQYEDDALIHHIVAGGGKHALQDSLPILDPYEDEDGDDDDGRVEASYDNYNNNSVSCLSFTTATTNLDTASIPSFYTHTTSQTNTNTLYSDLDNSTTYLNKSLNKSCNLADLLSNNNSTSDTEAEADETQNENDNDSDCVTSTKREKRNSINNGSLSKFLEGKKPKINKNKKKNNGGPVESDDGGSVYSRRSVGSTKSKASRLRARLPKKGKKLGFTIRNKSSKRSPSAIPVLDPLDPNNPKYMFDEEYDKQFFLVKTSLFDRICDWAFELVDTEKSGVIDEKELYSGSLLIHIKLGSYAGPIACKPLDRNECRQLFIKYDHDTTGTIDKDAFKQIMMVSCSNFLRRVTIMWLFIVIFVPLIAKTFLEICVWFYFTALPKYLFHNYFDNHHKNHNYIYNSSEELQASIIVNNTNYNDTLSYDYMTSNVTTNTNIIDDNIVNNDGTNESNTFVILRLLYKIIPESFLKNTIPLTFASCILGMMIIPWILFQIDDLIQKYYLHKAHSNQHPTRPKNRQKQKSDDEESQPKKTRRKRLTRKISHRRTQSC